MGEVPSPEQNLKEKTPEMNDLETDKKSSKSELLTLKNKKIGALYILGGFEIWQIYRDFSVYIYHRKN